MPRNTEIRLDDYFTSSAQQPLRSYFGKVVEGQPQVYDTPFAKGESTEHMLSAWNDVLKSIDNKWPSLYAFENDLAKKVGPLSVMEPLAQRLNDIESYYSAIRTAENPIDERATKAVLREWGSFRGLRVRDQKVTVELMKKSTNSGSPYFTKRRNVVQETYPCRVAPVKKFVHQGLNVARLPSWHQSQKSKWWEACAVLGWRGQEGGPSKEDVKQRVVWMFPFAVNIRELQVYQPAIEAAQKFNVYPAWVSMDAVDRGITKLFDTKSDETKIVCTDFTKFDQHFNENLQKAAYNIIKGLLTPDNKEWEWLELVFPIKYMIPLMYDYGKIRYGKHGMGSGSGGTNFDETIAHRALQFEAAISKGAYLNPHSQCLGDDGILSYPGITVEDVVDVYKSHGLEMNIDKQYASTQDCVYLRRWHHKDYRVNGICAGVYSTMRALGRLRYLERWMNPEVWGPEAVALRQLSILENVKYHPLKQQFVKFCMERDKYRLGIDIPNFLDNVGKLAEKYIDDMPDFMGYTKTLQADGDGLVSGISQWWIVRYLKSL